MSAESSRYAWTHKDSRTKPLHDATAQMAVDAQMQRHKQLTLQRCKTNIASNAKHPFLTTIEVFRQTVTPYLGRYGVIIFSPFTAYI